MAAQSGHRAMSELSPLCEAKRTSSGVAWPLGALFDHPGADLVELGNGGVQVLLHLGQALKQLLDLLPRKALDRCVHPLPGERDQLGFQRASLGGEMNVPFAAVLLVLYPAD